MDDQPKNKMLDARQAALLETWSDLANRLATQLETLEEHAEHISPVVAERINLAAMRLSTLTRRS